MKVLSIESSCDETSAAVVELVKAESLEVLHEPSTNSSEPRFNRGEKASGKRSGIEKIGSQIIVHSNVTATSLLTHAKTGGIIPENAAREQVKYIIPVITQALFLSCHPERSEGSQDSSALPQNDKADDWKQASEILRNDIDAIAVTYGPGLIGSLLVGVETAKTLSFAFNKPLIPVNHLLGHLFANWLVANRKSQIEIPTSDKRQAISFPFIGLIVSGAHTDLLLFESIENYKWLGGTRDDAAGECFDKCARLLGFDYPGGPKISKLAEKGNAKSIQLPKLMKDDSFDFSFSGLKTAFMNIVNREFEILKTPTKEGYAWNHAEINNLSEEKQQLLYDLCASLEQTIIEVITRKTMKAAEKYNCSTILLGGGVSANTALENAFQSSIINNKSSMQIFVPQKKFATDNAAMIGAYALLNYKPVSWRNITADPELYFS